MASCPRSSRWSAPTVSHVTSGLIWMAVLMFQVSRRGLTSTNRTRILCLSLFWHFLDVVWICVFSVVYLMGAM